MRPLALVLALLAFSAVAVACARDEDEDALATVGDEKIGRDEVESLISLYRRRAEAEGEEEAKKGEKVNHVQEVAALQVLVLREVLEQKAKELGVRLDEGEVERSAEALKGQEGETREDEGNEEAKLEDQFRETARAQLLYQVLSRRVTRDVRVPRERILAFYRSHTSLYSPPGKRAPKVPPRRVERAIARGLLEIERSKVFAAWLKRVRREFAPMIEYSRGWAPSRVTAPSG